MINAPVVVLGYSQKHQFSDIIKVVIKQPGGSNCTLATKISAQQRHIS